MIRKKRKTDNNFLLCLIGIFLVSVTKFFYLIPLPYPFSNEASNVSFSAFVAVIIFIIFLGRYQQIKVGKFGIAIGILFLILISNAFYMMNVYNLNLTSAFGSQFFYLMLLAYFPIIYFLKDEEQFYKFCTLLESISLILCVVLLCQNIIFKLNGRKFLQIAAVIGVNGRIYSVAEGLIRISVIISAYKLLDSQLQVLRKKVSFFNLIVGIYSIILVDQSRIYLISIIISILTIIILGQQNKMDAIKILFYVLLAICLIYLFYTMFQSLLSTMSDNNNGSNYARKEAIDYYIPLVKKNFWTGIGNIVPNPSSTLFYYLKGPLGIYNYDDIGIFGIFVTLGIFGLGWYIWIIIKSLRIAKKAVHMKALLYGLWVEIIVSVFTMSYLDYSRIVSLVLFLSIMSFGDTYKK
ncbi:O-antigen ligase family protein [Lactobacillus helveticus]|uniref:O-antigen ligase family protein n=1 Tax=Lactobacillus helveticus TaxID=1587 RepID=UPI0015628F7F|nr:O-antigen ligase family protein [Lactobacillus helveticus]NRN85379.1 hypothetical protein [Lactobacillus helveticus]NRO00152.1 hypothetical protein [Lactobacillus helveticus]